MMRRSIFPRIDPGRLAATDSIQLLVPSVNFQRQHSPRVHQFGEKARGLPVPAFLLPSRALKRLAASGANFPLSRSLPEHICHHVLPKVGRHGRVSCSVRGPKRSPICGLDSDSGEDAAEADFAVLFKYEIWKLHRPSTWC